MSTAKPGGTGSWRVEVKLVRVFASKYGSKWIVVWTGGVVIVVMVVDVAGT
jgi:hypothetical protein